MTIDSPDRRIPSIATTRLALIALVPLAVMFALSSSTWAAVNLKTWASGDTLTAADLNANFDALAAAMKSRTTPVQEMVSGTIYQNTGTRSLMVVAFQGATGAAHEMSGFIGASSPPSTLVTSTGGPGDRMSITFVVPPGMFYMATTTPGFNLAQAWEM